MKNRNIILGINWEQNSSASLMIENKIVGCSSEERFSKVKNDEIMNRLFLFVRI